MTLGALGAFLEWPMDPDGGLGCLRRYLKRRRTAFPTAGTFPLSNNTDGQIVGYVNNNGLVGTADGTITSFDVSGAACCTVPESINSAGVMAGGWEDANGAHRGFFAPPPAP